MKSEVQLKYESSKETESLISATQKLYCDRFCDSNFLKMLSNELNTPISRETLTKKEKKTPIFSSLTKNVDKKMVCPRSFKIQIIDSDTKVEKKLQNLLGKNSFSNLKPILETEKLKNQTEKRRIGSFYFNDMKLSNEKFLLSSPRNLNPQKKPSEIVNLWGKFTTNEYNLGFLNKKYLSFWSPKNQNLQNTQNLDLGDHNKSNSFQIKIEKKQYPLLENEQNNKFRISQSNIYFKTKKNTMNGKNNENGNQTNINALIQYLPKKSKRLGRTKQFSSFSQKTFVDPNN